MKTVGFKKYRLFVIAAAAVCGTLVVGMNPAAAQTKAPTSGATFGSVNVEQVLNESKGRQKDVADLNQMVTALRNVMGQLQENGARFLADAEIKELAALYEKPADKLTEPEKKRKQALEDQATLKSAAKKKLENTPSPTDDDRKKYADLNDTEQKGNLSLKNLSDDFAKRVDSRDAELSNKTVTQIKEVIAKIAQEKNLSVVFDSKVAIYTSNDITADVVKQINK